MENNKYDLIQTVLTIIIFILIGTILIAGSGVVEIHAFSDGKLGRFTFYDNDTSSGLMIASFALTIIISGFFVEALIRDIELNLDTIKNLTIGYLILLTFVIISLVNLINQINYINSIFTISGKLIVTLQSIIIILIIIILIKNILIDFANVLDKRKDKKTKKDSYENLTTLKDLFDKGIINESEYNEKRRKYLNKL